MDKLLRCFYERNGAGHARDFLLSDRCKRLAKRDKAFPGLWDERHHRICTFRAGRQAALSNKMAIGKWLADTKRLVNEYIFSILVKPHQCIFGLRLKFYFYILLGDVFSV